MDKEIVNDFKERLTTQIENEMSKNVTEVSINRIDTMLEILRYLRKIEKHGTTQAHDEIEQKMLDILDEYKGYRKYKEDYRKSNDNEHKQIMLDELQHMLCLHEMLVDMIYSCTDCMEERNYIKSSMKANRQKYVM